MTKRKWDYWEGNLRGVQVSDFNQPYESWQSQWGSQRGWEGEPGFKHDFFYVHGSDNDLNRL